MQDMQEMAPEAARAEIENLPLNGEFLSILQDPAHPGHKAATVRRRGLYVAAYPGEPGDGRSDDGEAADSTTEDGHVGGSLFDAPASARDYRFDATPPGLKHDAGLERRARGWFREAGVPQWLARNIVNEWNRLAAGPLGPGQSDGHAATTEAVLRKLWGDAYDAKVDKADAVLRAIGEEEIFDLLSRSGLANSEYLVRQLVALAESREGR